MAAISIAIVGKDNEPLYMKEFPQDNNKHDDHTIMLNDHNNYDCLFGLVSPPSSSSLPSSSSSSSLPSSQIECSIKQQFILHSALDRLEQLGGPPPGYGWRVQSGASGTEGMFVGLLLPVEEMRVYGYVTTTKIKFVLVIEEDDTNPESQPTVDLEIKNLLNQLHEVYIRYRLNPFHDMVAPIASCNTFDEQIQHCIDTFNQSDGMI
jgi:hypothetical protein